MSDAVRRVEAAVREIVQLGGVSALVATLERAARTARRSHGPDERARFKTEDEPEPRAELARIRDMTTMGRA